MRTLRKNPQSLLLENEPLWYKDALIYQLHVRAFCDSNGDGMCDFAGLTETLDYLQDLGVTALWLLPFYPSPLRDDGYDIADYTDVHPNYGTLHDFKTFLREAHQRGHPRIGAPSFTESLKIIRAMTTTRDFAH